MNPDQNFFVVWNPQAGPPTYRHATYEEARREAVRLAGEARGQEFFVLEARAVAKLREPVEVRELLDADEFIPF